MLRIHFDGTEVYFDDPAAIEALEYWVSLATEHDAMPSGTIEWGTLRQNFLEQSTAMMWHTTGNLTAVRNEANFEFGVAMLPMKTQRGSPTGGGNFYIFEDASEEEQRAAMRVTACGDQTARTGRDRPVAGINHLLAWPPCNG